MKFIKVLANDLKNEIRNLLEGCDVASKTPVWSSYLAPHIGIRGHKNETSMH